MPVRSLKAASNSFGGGITNGLPFTPSGLAAGFSSARPRSILPATSPASIFLSPTVTAPMVPLARRCDPNSTPAYAATGSLGAICAITAL